MPHQKLTQAVVDRLPFSDSTVWYHDQELAGFNLSVGQKSKTFYAAHETKGRFLRVKIGRADVVRVNVARELARNVLIPELRSGVDPRSLYWSDHDDTRTEGAPEARTILQGIRMSDEKAEGVLRGRRRVDADRVTVGQVWEAYEQAHIANLIENKGAAKAARARKHKTEQRRYLGGAERYGSDGPCAATLEYPRGWWDRPITSITPEEVSKTWRTLQVQRGRRTAQQFMMAAKVLFQFAVASDAVPVTRSPIFVDEGSNGRGLPKGWQTLTAKEPERIDDLRAWWREVDKLDVVPKSALKLMLLTGLRPSEALSLTWDQVDLERRKIVFTMTKTTGAREVALSSWSVNQLKRLERFDGKRNFVFCGPTGGRLHEVPKSGKVNSGMVRDLRGTVEREKAAIGVLITLQPASKDMKKEAVDAPLYETPWGKHGSIQVLTIEELLNGGRIDMPPIRLGGTSIPTIARADSGTQESLF